jgi:hypothetical protein
MLNILLRNYDQYNGLLVQKFQEIGNDLWLRKVFVIKEKWIGILKVNHDFFSKALNRIYRI